MREEVVKKVLSIKRRLVRTLIGLTIGLAKSNMSIDWNLRESVQAKMRVTVKRLLKKYGYPPDLQNLAVDTVMKQAELMAEEEASTLTEERASYN